VTARLWICAYSDNPKPISAEAPCEPHVADYGQEKGSEGFLALLWVLPTNEPLALLTSPAHPNPVPPPGPLLARFSGIACPAIKAEGFPIILLCAVFNGNINFTEVPLPPLSCSPNADGALSQRWLQGCTDYAHSEVPSCPSTDTLETCSPHALTHSCWPDLLHRLRLAWHESGLAEHIKGMTSWQVRLWCV